MKDLSRHVKLGYTILRILDNKYYRYYTVDNIIKAKFEIIFFLIIRKNIYLILLSFIKAPFIESTDLIYIHMDIIDV